MRKLKTAITRLTIHAQTGAQRALQKLHEQGGSSEFVAMLILCVIVVVVGGVLLVLFNASVKEWWATLSGRISEMFNYK